MKKVTKKSRILSLGIDPGKSGAFVLFDGEKILKVWQMPLKKNDDVDQEKVFGIINEALAFRRNSDKWFGVYLEKAVSFGMGTKGAFNYGRGFAALEITLNICEVEINYVEPNKWTKEMHHGISKDLKPKIKSLTALHLNHKALVKALPTDRKGKLLDGPVDALLIAIYGYKQITDTPQDELDFF